MPKKLFKYASEYSRISKEAKGFGWSFPAPEFILDTLVKNKNTAIQMLNKSHSNTLKDQGISLLHGDAAFIDPHTLSIGDKSVSANIS